MQIVSNIALISINETIVVQMVSFLIFLFIINRVMFRPLKRALAERGQYIESLQAGIAQSETRLHMVTNQIKESEAIAKAEAIDAAKAVELSGKQRADEIVAATREDVAAQIEKAHAEIDTQVETASRDMEKEAESLAVSIMERLLDRKLPQ
jgi:F-type H+-transporting ATPase subunit b